GRPSGCDPNPCYPGPSGGLPLAPIAFSGGRELDLLLVGRADDHALDVDAGQMDAVGVEAAGRHHFLDLDHADLAASRGGQVEVARGLAEYEVAGLVRLPCLDDAQVGKQPAFE